LVQSIIICRRGEIQKIKFAYETQIKMKAKAPHWGKCKTKIWSRIWQQLNCATKYTFPKHTGTMRLDYHDSTTAICYYNFAYMVFNVSYWCQNTEAGTNSTMRSRNTLRSVQIHDLTSVISLSLLYTNEPFRINIQQNIYTPNLLMVPYGPNLLMVLYGPNIRCFAIKS
jgi:hypothetical protein